MGNYERTGSPGTQHGRTRIGITAGCLLVFDFSDQFLQQGGNAHTVFDDGTQT